MPASIPLHQRSLPDRFLPPPRRPRETDAERKDRQLALIGELTDINMLAARDAGSRIVERPDGDPVDTTAASDPTLALSRATRAVIGLINVENRIVAGETAPAPVKDDPRGVALRKLLHPLVNGEPDAARRRATRQRLNVAIDDALSVDLDDDLPLGEIALAIAKTYGLNLQISKMPDEFLISNTVFFEGPFPPNYRFDRDPRYAPRKRPPDEAPDG